jgi:signal transduction histidine kinase
MENQLSVVLSRNKLLKNVNISKIDFTGINGKLFTISEGEILYREGDNAKVIYLIISGEINILKKRILGKTKSYLFTENDFFGHEEYFEETSRFSTAVALRDSYLIALTKEEIEFLVKQNNRILENLKMPAQEVNDEINSKMDLETSEKKEPIKEKLETPTETQLEPETPTIEDDFFRSIADSSRTDDSEIVQPLNKKTKEEFINEENKQQDFNEDKFLDKDGIPRAEGDFSDLDEIESEGIQAEPIAETLKEPVKRDTKIRKDAETLDGTRADDLDDALKKILGEEEAPELTAEPIQTQKAELEFKDDYLNEDGIPKAEFDFTEQKELSEEKISEPEFQEEDQKYFNEDKIPKPVFDSSDHKDVALEETLTRKRNYDFGEDSDFSIPPKQTADFEITEKDKQTNDFGESEFVSSEEDEVGEISTELEEQIQTEPIFSREERKTDSEDEKFYTEPDIQAIKDRDAEEEKNFIASSFHIEQLSAEHLQQIVKAVKLINSTIKSHEAHKNIIDSAIELTNAERGTLYLIDKDKEELWPLTSTGNDMKETRLKFGEGLSGFVAKSGESINIKNAQRDQRFRAEADSKSGFVTNSVLAFPIKNNKKETIAVLQLFNSKKGEFSLQDEELLSAMSVHLSNTLQNTGMVEKLLYLERFESLVKMVNFLNQEIKRPILVSKRYAEHLKSKPLPPDLGQIVNMLLEQLTIVTDVVQTTMSCSDKKSVLRTLNVSLNNTLSDYSARITAYVDSRNCQIITEFDKDITVKLDVKEFYQCFMNIVKNACDAMPDGGNIYISTKRDDLDYKVKIYFRDNGIGIADNLKEKIFEPFFAHGKKEGAGLGLAVTKKIVIGHNGTIDVQSSLGKGTTFIIVIPYASAF